MIKNLIKDGAFMSSISVPSSIGKFKVKYHYDHVQIYTPKELASSLSLFNPGDRVSFVPDPDNPKDKNAVSVVHPSGLCGYLLRNRIQDMVNDYIGKEWLVYSHIDSIDDDDCEITLFIAFYAPSRNSESFELTGSRGEDAQSTIALIDEGDELDLEYDDDSGRYIAFALGDPIGFLPKSANEYAESYTCYVDSISDDDPAVVSVYFE